MRVPLVLVAMITLILTVSACGGGGDGASTTTADAGAGSTAMQQMDGRGVSATDDELVLRTAGGEWTFKIRPEDVAAVDPEHFNSHVDVPTIGFRVFYVTQDGVDYAVSVEEIDASSLGFS
jgi:hypothetical protein